MSKNHKSDPPVDALAAKLQRLEPNARKFFRMVIDVIVDLDSRSADHDAFIRWVDTVVPSRSWDAAIVTLPTGAWRDEIRRSDRRKVLRLAGGDR